MIRQLLFSSPNYILARLTEGHFFTIVTWFIIFFPNGEASQHVNFWISDVLHVPCDRQNTLLTVWPYCCTSTRDQL
jgi:hypothetical protein